MIVATRFSTERWSAIKKYNLAAAAFPLVIFTRPELIPNPLLMDDLLCHIRNLPSHLSTEY